MYRHILLVVCLLLYANAYSQTITPAQKPNKLQAAMIKRGYGMFIHFGVNTFGNTEWSDGSIDVSRYNPTELDCDQWVRVARDAGFRYVLLVTKHHDGFCLWDSRYTNYDVASSPIKTDVVAEVSRACKKYGLEFAVYYSLWDRKEPTYRMADFTQYIQYMENQLYELLTGYGPVCELWLDGGWDKPAEKWELPRLYSFVKRLQPNCAISTNQTITMVDGENVATPPDSMVVDNRYSIYYFPSDFRLWDPKIVNRSDKKQYRHNAESYYLPYEHTICLSKEWSWFAKEGDRAVRDLDELEELFYWCTANNNTLVINVPPAQNGKIKEYEAARIIELGKRAGIRKGKPLPTNGEFLEALSASASSVWNNSCEEYGAQKSVDGGLSTRWAAQDKQATLTIDIDKNKPFNKITIFEYCDMVYAADGIANARQNRIQEYKIEIFNNNRWQTIYMSDQPMYDCKVINLIKTYKASKVRLNITKASEPASVYEINIIHKTKQTDTKN